MNVGDSVVRNPATWTPSEFDQWGAGRGVGEVVDKDADGNCDVRWPGGREWRAENELLPAP